MHRNTDVFNYVIDHINSVLKHGIEYYSDKDQSLKDELIGIYDYINNDDNVDVVIDIKKETPVQDIPSASSTEEVKKLANSFMDKMADIKISVLNLDTDEKYVLKQEAPKEVEKVQPEVEEKSVLANMLERLKNEDFDDIAFDEVDGTFSNVSDEELLLNDDEDDILGKTKFDIFSDINNDMNLEKVEDDTIDEESGESLLDIFRKND